VAMVNKSTAKELSKVVLGDLGLPLAYPDFDSGQQSGTSGFFLAKKPWLKALQDSSQCSTHAEGTNGAHDAGGGNELVHIRVVHKKLVLVLANVT
jgi:hypothetical protein